jgi:hypothetical protein
LMACTGTTTFTISEALLMLSFWIIILKSGFHIESDVLLSSDMSHGMNFQFQRNLLPWSSW